MTTTPPLPHGFKVHLSVLLLFALSKVKNRTKVFHQIVIDNINNIFFSVLLQNVIDSHLHHKSDGDCAYTVRKIYAQRKNLYMHLLANETQGVLLNRLPIRKTSSWFCFVLLLLFFLAFGPHYTNTFTN